MNEASSCSPSTGCCTPNRRDFLRFTGLGTAAMFAPRVFAGPFEANANASLGLDAKHPVPLDKKLSAISVVMELGKRPVGWQRAMRSKPAHKLARFPTATRETPPLN